MSKSTTAMMCLFARANHQQYEVRVLKDCLSKRLITNEEYNTIYDSIEKSKEFFGCDNAQQAINRYISPAVLGRGAFLKRCIRTEKMLGAKRLLVLGAGYDTISLSPLCRDMEAIEIDRDLTDKISRLNALDINTENVSFTQADISDASIGNSDKKTIAAAMGLSFYMDRNDFEAMTAKLSNVMISGSAFVFDYPDLSYNPKLKPPSEENMKAKYNCFEMEALLSRNGFRIYELLNNDDIDRQFFSDFNKAYADAPLIAEKGISYCLAVKK